MATRRLPDAEVLPAITIDRLPVRIRGWRTGFDRFAFALTPDVDGKYQALVIRTGTFEHAWPCDTLEEAQGIAAQEYVATIGGPARAEILTDDAGRLYWTD